MPYDLEFGRPEFESPARLTEADDIAPELNDYQPTAPEPSPAPLPATQGQDPLRAYLESKLANRGQRVDPQLQRAQDQERIQNVMNSVHGGGGDAGRSIVNAAAASANALAGKGWDAGGSVVPGPTQTPSMQAGSPVQEYLAAKRAQETQDGSDLRGAIAASKMLKGQDPDSIEAQRVALARDQLEETKKQHGFKNTHTVEVDDPNKERGLTVREKGQEERDRHNKITEDIARERMSLQKQLQGARDSVSREKILLAIRRLDQGQERLDRDLGDRTVDGYDGLAAKSDAKDLRGFVGNTRAAVDQLHKLADLRREMGVTNGILPTDGAARFEAAYHALQPVINSAEFKTAWNKQHGENFTEQLRSPTDLKNWLNRDYFMNQVGEIVDTLQSNMDSRASASGLKPRKDASGNPMPGHVSKPGANGRASGPPTIRDQAPDSVKMIGPDGSTRMVKKADVQRALAAGGKMAE